MTERQNESLTHYTLKHFTLWGDDVWFTFESDLPYKYEDKMWLNTYTLNYSLIKEFIPYDDDGLSYLIGCHKWQNDFNLYDLIYEFKRITKIDITSKLSKGSHTLSKEELKQYNK